MGASGTGKSALSRELKAPVVRSGGFFVTGKFDLHQRLEPYSAFVHAFSELCEQILDKEDSLREEMTGEINEAVGKYDAGILTDVIPDLKRIIELEQKEGEADAAATGSIEKRNRLHYLFEKFARAVSTPLHPLVVLLDDVHWADEASLDLINTLAKDTENSSLLLVVTCRKNSTTTITEEYPYMTLLRSLEEKEVAEKKIMLDNLDLNVVNSIVCNLLRSSEDVTKPLADIVHRKTHGSAYFVIELMKSLVDDKLLNFNFGTMCWQWDEDEIDDISITSNVADLMSTKLQKLPSADQLVLQVAGCIGQKFDEIMLESIIEKILGSGLVHENEALQIKDILNSSLREGFLQYEKAPIGDHGGTYKFVHDQIENAAFNLISEEMRPKFCLLIGTQLLLDAEVKEDVERIIFVAVNLCIDGSASLGKEENIKLAEYSALAGNKVGGSVWCIMCIICHSLFSPERILLYVSFLYY
jgi:predicted ATPase